MLLVLQHLRAEVRWGGCHMKHKPVFIKVEVRDTFWGIMIVYETDVEIRKLYLYSLFQTANFLYILHIFKQKYDFHLSIGTVFVVYLCFNCGMTGVG
jgi:hypothetical protein